MSESRDEPDVVRECETCANSPVLSAGSRSMH